MIKRVLLTCRKCGNPFEVIPYRATRAKFCSPSCKKKFMAGRPQLGNTFVHRSHPLYSIWKVMWTRCTNPNRKDYKHYGGKGISVCGRWQDFEKFVEDMGPRPTSKHEIDRRDNLKGYEPGNCRWVTHQEQLNNFSRNRIVTLNGKSKSVADWCRELKLSLKLIYGRLKDGWSEEESFTLPHFLKKGWKKIGKHSQQRQMIAL